MNEIIRKMQIKQKKIDAFSLEISQFNQMFASTLIGFIEALEELYVKKSLTDNNINKMSKMFEDLKATNIQKPNFKEYYKICKFEKSSQKQFYQLQKIIQSQSIIVASKLNLSPCSMPILKLNNEKSNQMDIESVDISRKFIKLNNFFLNIAKPLIEKTYTLHFQEESLSLSLLKKSSSDTTAINRETNLIRSLSAQRVNCFIAYNKFNNCLKEAHTNLSNCNRNSTIKYLEKCELIQTDINNQNPCLDIAYQDARQTLSIKF